MKSIFKFIFFILISLANALFFWSAVTLFASGMTELGIIQIIIALFIDFAVLNPKGYPYRYIIPALFFLSILTIYPIFFTFKTAFTNYGTGHIFTREQVVESLLKEYEEKSDSEPFNYKVFVKMKDYTPTEESIIVFFNTDGKYLAQTPSITERDKDGNTTKSISDFKEIKSDFVVIGSSEYHLSYSLSDPDKIISISKINGNTEEKYTYFFDFNDSTTIPNQKFFISNIYLKYYDKVNFMNESGNIIKFGKKYGFRKLIEAEKKYSLDTLTFEENGKAVQRTVFINNKTGRSLIEENGYFYETSETGKRDVIIGYTSYVGMDNFEKLFNDPRLSGPFMRIFTWTLIWATLSVLFSFSIGLGFALILNDRKLKGKKIYRTLLIIPWAIPAFISVLVWRNGFFNETYGIINKIILGQWLNAESIQWLGDAFWAKVSVLIVNVWLGFPYMMTVCLGALQSIPMELYEAASIDGATKTRKFGKITFPLLMTSVAPLLVGSFAFNFNNFTNIYLLTKGGPSMAESITNAGETDILISYTYKLAFQGEQGQDFGYASAIAIFIFLLVAGISVVNFKLSGAFEEVNR